MTEPTQSTCPRCIKSDADRAIQIADRAQRIRPRAAQRDAAAAVFTARSNAVSTAKVTRAEVIAAPDLALLLWRASQLTAQAQAAPLDRADVPGIRELLRRIEADIWEIRDRIEADEDE